MNRSGWVREVDLEMDPATSSSRKGAGGGAATDYTVQVRCESALPVRLARRLPEGNTDSQQYVFSITGLPLPFLATLPDSSGLRSMNAVVDKNAIAAQIAQSSWLQREGKDPIAAEHAMWHESNFVLRINVYFPIGPAPIRIEDRDLIFSSRFHGVMVRANFTLKKMIYRGRLAI
ncbi:MAG: hypothetical protein U0Q18_31000 [Bryobacteraceae bacterium]